MNRFALALFLIGMLAIAACGTAPPNSEQWCFRFKFKYDNFGFGVAQGEWIPGVGFAANEMGQLAISYVHPLTVSPVHVEIKVTRVDTEVSTDIAVNASANVFGLESGTISQTLPSLLDNITLGYTATTAGIAGNSINITAEQNHTDLPLALEYLEVRGSDVNPFGSVDNCDASTVTPSATLPPVTSTEVGTSTLTPVPPTPTPTPTWSPSPSPTNTGTLSPTPVSDWCHVLDFTEDLMEGGGALQDWYIDTGDGSGAQGSALWVDGSGYTNAGGDANHQAVIILGIRFNNNFGSGSDTHINITHTHYWTDDIPDRFTRSWLFEDAADIDFNTTGTAFSDSSVSDENDLTYGGSPGVHAIFFVQQNFTGTPFTGHIYRALICGYGFDPFGDLPTPSPTPSLTPTGTLSPTPSNTVNPLWTLTYTPRVLSTPLTITPTLTRTRTPLPLYIPPTNTYVLGTLPPPNTPWATVTAHASYTPNAGGTADANSTLTATYAGTSMPSGTGTPVDIPWLTPMPGSGGTGEGGIGDGGTALDMAGYGNNLIGFAVGAMRQGFQWLGEMRIAAVGVITAYTNAAPQSIPQLPHCATDRFASELCAIWYILQYTVFSGLIGSLLIPLAVIDADLFILILFVRYVRAIVSRLASIVKNT